MTQTLDLAASDGVLIVAVHPDDETLAAGGLIQRTLGAGGAVRIVFVTSGEDNPWPQPFLERRWRIGPLDRACGAALRRHEALAAMRRLGVESDDAVFLDFPDQGLTARLLGGDSTVVTVLARHLVGWHPTVLAGPSLFELHPDHNACAVLLDLALASRPFGPPPRLRLAHRVHGPRLSARLGDRLSLELTQQEQNAKREAICGYPSQLALSRHRFLGFARGTEEFFLEEQSAEHPVQRAYLCREALRIHISRKGRGNPLRPTYLHLVQRGANSWASLSVAIPSTSSDSPILKGLTGARIATAKCLGNEREAEIRLPGALLQCRTPDMRFLTD
jgi:LmbE family N-acetylglucosaminyl deacetylase